MSSFIGKLAQPVPLMLGQIPGELRAPIILGAVLAAVCLAASPSIALALVVGLFGLAGVIVRPELGLLAILVVTSTVVPEESIPLLPIGVGSLNMADVMLLGMFGLMAMRKLSGGGFRMVDSPLALPMLAFLGTALLSTLVAIAQGSVASTMAVREIRTISYYLCFFLVLGLVPDARRALFLVRGIMLLATLVAAAMVVQYLVGASYQLLPGRVEDVAGQATTLSSVTRILPPGQSLVLVGPVILIVTLALAKFSPLRLLQVGQLALLSLALLFTFNRNFWVALGLAVLLLAILAGSGTRRRLAIWAVVAVAAAIPTVIISVEAPGSPVARMMDAVLSRAGTLGSGDTLEEDSLQMRYVENSYAIPQLLSHPGLGLGMGAQYRPLVQGVDYELFDGRGYVHNGHFWIMMKAGMLGYAFFLWLSLAFIIRSLRGWRRVADPRLQVIVLGFALSYVGILAAAVVAPIFTQWFWVPIIGIIMGVNEAILAEAGSHERAPRRSSVPSLAPRRGGARLWA